MKKEILGIRTQTWIATWLLISIFGGWVALESSSYLHLIINIAFVAYYSHILATTEWD